MTRTCKAVWSMVLSTVLSLLPVLHGYDFDPKRFNKRACINTLHNSDELENYLTKRDDEFHRGLRTIY